MRNWRHSDWWWVCFAALACGVYFGCLTWGGCRFIRPIPEPDLPLRVATSIGRLACTVEVAEGNPAEILLTRSALDAIDIAVGGERSDMRTALSLFPRRIQPYIALLLIESSAWTTREFLERAVAFVGGCREVLAPVSKGGSVRLGDEHSGRQSKRLR